MKLLRSFPALAFTLVLLSITGLCVAQNSIGLLVVAGTLAAMSWYITEGPRGRTLPRWVSNVLVIGVSLHVFVDLFQHRDDVMGVLGRFAVLLTLIKLYERRTARDHAHLLTLSLLLIMTGALQSDGLLFGVILLLYAGLGLYVLLLYQLYTAYESARNGRLASTPKDYRLAPPIKPILGRNVGLHFRTQALGVAIAGLMLSLFVFLAYPRGVGANMLGRLPTPSITRKTQFSWTVDLMTGGRITNSRLRVFNVQITDNQGRVVHRDEPLLLRGAVLDDYQGQGRWRTAEFGRGPRRGRPTEARGLPPLSTLDSQTIIQRITVSRPDAAIVPLFSLYAPIAWETDPEGAAAYDPIHQTLRTSNVSHKVSEYTVMSHPSPADGPVELQTRNDQPLPQSRWFPDVGGKVGELARQVLTDARLPLRRPNTPTESLQWSRDAANAFTRFLQSGTFAYTTDLSGIVHGSLDEDPITRFLTASRRGHCEYFASGLVAMCHSIDIPARVVVGYVAYDFDKSGQEYNVLESNAHAWAEVFAGDGEWTTFDPTPPLSLLALHSSENSLADTVRNFYESFEGDWNSTIIGFDGATQSHLAESFNQSWSTRVNKALDSVRDWMERVNQAFYFGPAGYIWMGMVALALVIAVIALVKLMRRSRAVRNTLQLQHLRGGEYQRMLRQLGFYLDMLAVLKRGGWTKPIWQPPLDFAQFMAAKQPAAAEVVGQITNMFYAARYGYQRLERDDMEKTTRLLDQLAAALKTRRV